MSNFLVTDIKVIDSPQAGIGVARCLKTLGHKVYGIDDTPFVTNSDLFEAVFVIEEIRTLNLDNLVKKLINIKNLYHIDYIIPCYDETSILLSYIKDKLNYIGIQLIAPDIEVIKRLKKENLVNTFSGINNKQLLIPETKVISSIKEAENYAMQINYPLVVKGMTKGVKIVENSTELSSAIKYICNIWNNGEIHCIIQKFIQGKSINALLSYKDERIVSYLEMEKIALDSNGATWFGKLTSDKNIFNVIADFCKYIKLNNSIIEIETILTEQGKYYVYEINYRPPAWIYSPALNGQNFLDIFLNPQKTVIFNNINAFFGRESNDFVKPLEDISQYEDLQFYAKGAAYKNDNQKYPSEIMI